LDLYHQISLGLSEIVGMGRNDNGYEVDFDTKKSGQGHGNWISSAAKTNTNIIETLSASMEILLRTVCRG